jgi:hypothetical protein
MAARPGPDTDQLTRTERRELDSAIPGFLDSTINPMMDTFRQSALPPHVAMTIMRSNMNQYTRRQEAGE